MIFAIFIWFIRTAKAVSFWIYLWQLKEYHIGRFVDHFRTDKGKKIFINNNFLLKILSAGMFFSYPGLVLFIVLTLYIFESFKTLIDLFLRRLKKPVLTKKTILLLLSGLFAEFLLGLIVYLYIKEAALIIFLLLLFDIFTPLIVSLIVLSFQPFAVLARNNIIKKATNKREKLKNVLVVGITGSYGKTSVKEFLFVILREKFGDKVVATKDHQNSEIGISNCILNDLKPEHEIFICEMGAYNVGGIKLLCQIAKPKIGVLTGINEQHMATFGSQDKIIKAKYELIESLPADGIAFFNAKNKYCVDLHEKTHVKKFLYGGNANIFGEENLLGAIAVAEELGLNESQIKTACDKMREKLSGIKAYKGINGVSVLDATYSANPNSVTGHLNHLKTISGKKVIVMPCLIELGKASKEVHKKIGKEIAEACDLAIITTLDRFKEMKEGAVSAGMKSESILFLDNPKDIIKKLNNFCVSGDIVLLESRIPFKVIKWLSVKELKNESI